MRPDGDDENTSDGSLEAAIPNGCGSDGRQPTCGRCVENGDVEEVARFVSVAIRVEQEVRREEAVYSTTVPRTRIVEGPKRYLRVQPLQSVSTEIGWRVGHMPTLVSLCASWRRHYSNSVSMLVS